MKITIVELGIAFEAVAEINGVRFFTCKGFDTVEEARLFLMEHGLEETK